MSRETRIALLVGLSFIVLFGFVLGKRSLSLSADPRAGDPGAAKAPPPWLAGPELVTAGTSEPAEEPAPASARTSQQRRAAGRGNGRWLIDLSVVREPSRPQPSRSTRQADEPASEVPRARTAPPALMYEVRPGDTLTKIARMFYGPGGEKHYLRIFNANRDKLTAPARLAVGQVLVIPPPPPRPKRPAARSPGTHYVELSLEGLAKRYRPGRTYVVRAGDSLTSIARRCMGDASRSALRKLIEANARRIDDPDVLPVGLELRIPDGA